MTSTGGAGGPMRRAALGSSCAVLGWVLLTAPVARAQELGRAPLAPRTVVIAAQTDSTGGIDSTFASSALDGRPIRQVDVVARNVFDPLPEGPFRFVGKIANRAHIRTRESVVREQLLFKAGDRWSEARARESVRLLRTLNFLDPLEVRAVPVGDSVDVTVETRDVWTTQPEANLERGGGQVFGSMAFTEKNLFGFGKSISFAYREDPIGIARSIDFSDPSVAGSRLQMRYSGSRGTTGASDGVSATLPFYAIDSPIAFGVAASRRAGEAHLFQNNAEVASLSEHVEETELFYGRGTRRGNNILRGVLSIGSLERRLGATRISSDVVPPASFVGPEETLRLRQVGLEFRLWRPVFVERTGVARPDVIEDYDLGTSFSVKLGAAPEFLGSSANYGTFRVKLDAGISTPVGFGLLRSQVSGRWRRSPEEVIQSASGRWIWQSGPTHTFEGAVIGVAGTRPARNFQTVIGGLNGLRAYPVHAVVGKRVMRWNLEDRQELIHDFFHIASIGSAAFVDGARGWGSGAEGTEWFHCAGVGLRIAPPRAAIGPVIRADLAWPISPTRDGKREAVLSIGSSQAF